MDGENMSEDDVQENLDKREESASNESNKYGKRVKTNDTAEKAASPEHDVGSTSTNSAFNRSRNARNRNYRKSSEEAGDTAESSDDHGQDSSNSRPRIDSESEGSEIASDLEDTLTVMPDTDSDVTDSEPEEHPVLKKQKPKHNWFIIPEITNRQLGFSMKKQSSQLFQRRCYGSLHCVQRLELMYKLERHEGCVNSLNFHPNGSLLASGSDDLKVVLWDWKIGTSLLSFETKHRANVFQSKFMPLSGDLHIATCARDGVVRLHQVSGQEGLRSSRKLGAHRGPCHKLAILHEQPHVLLSAGEDGIVFSHDVRNSKPDKVVNVRSEDREVTIALYSIAAHPLNSHEFCVSGRDSIIRTYDQRKCGVNCTPLHQYSHLKADCGDSYTGPHVTCAVYNHDGSEILASYNDDDIYIFDIDAALGAFAHQYQGHRNGATIKGVNFFGPKSEYIVSGSDCGNVYFWDKNTEGIVQWMLADDNGVVNCLEPHPQLPFICTSGLDWDVKVWVPSCEKDPVMADLAQTVKANGKTRGNNWTSSELNESQMLWMLWRHLHNTNRIHRVRDALAHPEETIDPTLLASSSSSSSNSDTLESDSDSDMGAPAGCPTS